MIRFVEIVNCTTFNPRLERTAIPEFSMGEVWINEKYVVNIQPSVAYKQLLAEGRLPADLGEAHEFTAITVNAGETTKTHVVVGEAAFVAARLQSIKERQLLKG
jgi:hypothetical protein